MSQQQPLRRARAIRRDLVPSHQQTAASQENRAIERSLMADLNRYVNLIRTELNKTESLQWTQLRAMIIPKLRPSVSQTIRGHLEQSYNLGAQYITSRVGLQGASFLTHSDIDNIKSLTQEFTDKFFARIQLSLNNTISKAFTNREPDSKINPNYITTSIAVTASSKALAEGTRMKAKSILQTNVNAQAVLSAATEKKKKKKKKAAAEPVPIVDPLLEELEGLEDFERQEAISTLATASMSLSLAGLAASQLAELRWVWICGLSPCPECSTMEGEVFSMQDLDFMPMPPDSMHPNCRCRILLL